MNLIKYLMMNKNDNISISDLEKIGIDRSQLKEIFGDKGRNIKSQL